jgi:hypothetical protein
MQDEWATWQQAAARREAAATLTPTAAEMLTAVLLAVASEIGRAQISARELDDLTAQVRERLAGRLE